MKTVDLRSDILVRPSEEMLEAMRTAAGKPRGYGFREDPDLQELEALTAKVLGLEDALFFPTCTMANQTALMIHCRPGEVVIADRFAHIGGIEASASAGTAGAVILPLDGKQGHFTADQIRAVTSRPKRQAARSIRLVWLENTHNHAGGTVIHPDAQDQIVEICHRERIPVHVDGARLWNAAAALGMPAARLARGADSVAVSLNKALGAPLGAMLAGSRDLIERALQVRQMLGGGWRPAGILAAAGVVALNTMRDRLVEDHKRARSLAEGLAELAGFQVDLSSVQSNIVVARPLPPLGGSLEILRKLDARGIRAITHGDDAIRFTVHADIDDEAIRYVLQACQELIARPMSCDGKEAKG